MKHALILAALLLVSCEEDRSLDERNVETVIRNLHISLKQAYASGSADTDRFIDEYYDSSAYYVTPWGTSEILDSTKSRLRAALPRVKDYDFSIESMQVKSYGDAATAFFVLRQDYKVDGIERNEYLPTTMVLERRGESWKIVHIHRSADRESWQQWFGGN
jgi:ketosteroid isomerase-like protein